MSVAQKKVSKSSNRPGKRTNSRSRIRMTSKRQKAIEKAISFWKSHSIDLASFKFEREEANAR
jgi:hypothetical protein